MRLEPRVFLPVLLTASMAAGPAASGDETTHSHHASSGGPAETVEAFHQALAATDREAVLELLAEDAVIFESGGAEMSPDEYAHHHLEADMAFSGATEREIVDRRVNETGDAAWVLTRTEVRGSFRGRDIASRGTETMVLARGEDGWRIAHIHWSSGPIP